MQLFSYFLFFIFLPFKNETTLEWQKGNANSTPIKSYLLIKVIITTVLSFIILITLIYFGLNLAFMFKK
jgi:predicted secreted protein